MTDAPVGLKGMSLDEFIERYSDEGPFEIWDGEIVKLTPNVIGPMTVSKYVFNYLVAYEKESGAGETWFESPFVLPGTERANWVTGSRVPDVMFVCAERLVSYRAEHPDWREKPLILVPDLVVEVVSPTDRYTKINRKVDGYLRDGVRLIWVIDMSRRTVTVHTQGSKQATTMIADETLSGGDVLPGFAVEVRALFS